LIFRVLLSFIFLACFYDDGGKSGDHSFVRKGDVNTEEINMEGFNSGGIFGKKLKANKLTAKGRGPVVATRTKNAASHMKKGMGKGKKIKKKMETYDKIMKEANKMMDAFNEEPDTTVTATFADKLETTEGTAILSSTKDSTATMKKREVADFNNQAKSSLIEQQKQVDQALKGN